MLTPAQQADVEAILAEGRKGSRLGVVDLDAAQRAYVRLCHARGWDGHVARLVHDAWHAPLRKQWDDDIPF